MTECFFRVLGYPTIVGLTVRGVVDSRLRGNDGRFRGNDGWWGWISAFVGMTDGGVGFPRSRE